MLRMNQMNRVRRACLQRAARGSVEFTSRRAAKAMAADIPTLRRILKSCRTIAMVGLSADWFRPSYFAAKYMQQHGYRIVPVNPRYAEILGERCYARLEDIPFAVDMVDVFRKPADVMPVARSAVAIGAKCLWQQLGVANAEADAKAAAKNEQGGA